MTRLTRFALNNPAITYLLMLVLLLGGLAALFGLKQELIPDVKFPVATVVTVWPGASADEVTRGAVKPIEKAVEDLDDVDVVEVSSRASDSFGAVTVRAEYGTSPDDLRTAIEESLKDVTLPEGAEEPEIVAFDFGDLPVVQASASGNLDQNTLQRLMTDEVVPELESLDGVSSVTLTGERADRLVIRLDPDKMRELGVTAQQVQGVLAANNLAIPAGSVEADGKTVPVVAGNRVRTVEDVRNLVLVGGGAGAMAGASGGAAAAGGPVGQPVAPPTAQPAVTATAVSGAAQRTRLVIVASGDTLDSLAQRFGSDPATIRDFNDLSSTTLVPGTALRIPVAETTALAPIWADLGATEPADVTPDILRRMLADNPEAVSDLTEAQLLALPAATVQALPLAVIMRQDEATRTLLMDRMTGRAEATPTPFGGAALGAGLPRLAAPLRQGTVIILGDVAEVERAPEDAQTINRTDGKQSIGLLVAKDSAANTVSVVTAVEEELADLEENNEALEGVEFSIVFEQASYIEESLASVTREAVLGALLAILVILLFLRSVRSTLVAAVSIPTSVLIAFLLMSLQGLTINLITLSGLTVAIGRVVDDSIVVLENIYRHIQRGENRLEAVFNGTREVASAITSSTLVTVAVFLPLAFVGGLTTQFFKPFAFTVTWALLASLFVAVTIVPLLAKGLLARDKLPEERETTLQRLYTPALEWALDHRVLTLVLATLFFLSSLLVYPFIPKTFLPNFGEKTVQVDVQLPPGSDLAATDLITQKVEQVLRDEEAIESIEATVGQGSQSFSFGFAGAGGGDTARASVAAKFADDNNDDPDEVVKRLRKAVNDVTSGEVVTTTVRLAASGGPAGGAYDLQILSDDEALLRETNDRVMAALKDEGNWEDEGYAEIPIEYLTSNLTEARPVLSVEVDPRRALEQGLAPAAVALAVRQALEGQDLGDIELDRDGETETVKAVIVYPEDMITTVDMLRDYEIVGPRGAVRLGDVAEVTETPGPVQITRVDGERAALISGEIPETDTFGVIAAAQRIVDDLELSDDVEVGAGVETSTQQSGFQDLLLALPVSLLIVYIIMVVAFGSLVHPFTILFSVPFALSGALFALAITQRPLGMSSLIGVMMLIGIVVTNAIVLVDLVQQYRDRGMDVRSALVRGGRTRLRPILMTALATIIALIPLALGIGGGESLIAEELAIVVIGGLLVSTFLTLIIVPVVYSYLDGVSRREHPADVAEELAHEHELDHGPAPDLTPPPAPPMAPGPEAPSTGLA